MDSRWERTRSRDENKILGCFPEIKRGLHITGHQKTKKEEKGYEKNNLFGWHGFAFCFAGHDELRPCTKDNAYEEQCPDAKRKLAGVDDL
jgi:hypothetical protein